MGTGACVLRLSVAVRPARTGVTAALFGGETP